MIVAMLTMEAGCNSVTVRSKQYLGLPSYPHTGPSSVEILQTEPQRPHERLGEIALEPQGDPSVT